MRICLMIEGQEDVSWEQWVALARACEESGIETLFRSDHYLSVQGEQGRASLDAWATLNALAAITSRLRLGTLVSPASFRRPSVLAKMVVTADHVSRGRGELGMGAGWLQAGDRETLAEACSREGREPLPLSVMIRLEGTGEEELREYESAGVSRVMLQHLEHADLDAVARVGRELG